MKVPDSHQRILKELHNLHGVLMHGERLYRALGFESYSGYYKSKKEGRLPISVFKIAERRGDFAWTSDVARFLTRQADHALDLRSSEKTSTLPAD